MLRDLVLKNRSYRRFVESEVISLDTLKELVDLARFSASGRNLQPLRFMLACDAQKNGAIFPHLLWAAYLKGVWPGPGEGERPAAYIIILGDKELTQNFGVDPGIAAQSILLGAVEKGYGGCMIASIERDGLRKALSIPERFEIVLVIALGKPAEKVFLEEMPADGSVKYWHDADEQHHVPKRSLEDLIIE